MVKNVAPAQTWEALAKDPAARLVDVRTDVEWANIGVPDLSKTGKEPILISWQVAPTMQRNEAFEAQLQQAGLQPDDKIYFLCRSGVRSLAAAEAARAVGYKNVFNIADGFEGPPDASGQRGTTAGWQADKLPWRR
jgi:rhodanese-related sulfurtransferase